MDCGGLSKKSNVKMSKECPKLAVMHNMSICNSVNFPVYGHFIVVYHLCLYGISSSIITVNTWVLLIVADPLSSKL